MARQHEQWLKSNMKGKYTQLDKAKNDVLNAMMHYKDLKPIMDKFMYNDGTSKNLVCLKGTIPVNYKGTTYNIPVAVWLQEPHPSLPPLCFVKPTNTMQVRQGKHVDANGRVYLPYLNEWRPNSHNLLGCIQCMIAVFSTEPPVYSKQAAPAPPLQPQSFPASPQSRPPYPAPGFAAQGPPTTNYQPNYPPQTPYPPMMNQQTPYPPSNSVFSQYPSYPPTNAMPTPTYPSQPPVSNLPVKSQTALDDSMIRASLLTAVNDKLKRRMKDTVAQADSEIALLKQTEEELRAGKDKLDTIIKRLENEINEADNNMITLETKNEELQKEIDLLQHKQDDLEVDEIVTATTPVYRQIVSSFAEEQGLEDAIYYLGEALHKDVVDVDTFLKHVRALSRQQFVLRAVIQKARKSAGLASVY